MHSTIQKYLGNQYFYRKSGMMFLEEGGIPIKGGWWVNTHHKLWKISNLFWNVLMVIVACRGPDLSGTPITRKAINSFYVNAEEEK